MYKTVTLLLITALLSLLFLAPAPAEASQVANILSLKGYVLVKSQGGEWRTPYLAMGLYEGDRVVVYNNSYAVIGYYQDGHMEYVTWGGGEYYVAEIGYNTTYEIWGSGNISSVNQSGSISVAGTGQISQKVGGVTGRPTTKYGITRNTIFYLQTFEEAFTFEQLQKLLNDDILDATFDRPGFTEKLNELGFAPEEAEVIIKYTKMEASLSTRPNFYVHPEYTLILSDENGTVDYENTELKRGELYNWTLEPKQEGAQSYTGVIYIISDEELQSIELSKKEIEKQVSGNPSDSTPYKLMGDYMFDLALYPEALEYYKKAAEIDKEDTELQSFVGKLENALNEALIKN